MSQAETTVIAKPKNRFPLIAVPIWLFSLALCTIIGAGGYWYYSTMIKPTNVVIQPGTDESTIDEEPEEEEEVETEEPTLVEVNYHTGTLVTNYELYTFQTKYPSNYTVLSDDMQTEFITQGGMAPPVLTFYKPLSITQLDKHLDENSEITIWSTSGFSSINDWIELIWQDEKFTLKKESTATYKEFKFTIQEGTITKKGKTLETKLAFLDLEKDATYFFQATGGSVEDFDTILKNFDTREARYKREGIDQ